MPENSPQSGMPAPSPGASARMDPMVGKRLASYEILSRVARGGMGVVYRARHVYIDRIVALKVLDPALAGRADLIERFRTEAQSLARVEHENVIKVVDILEEQGVHFIVMDFADGVNLRVLVKEKGPLAGSELLSVARQSADALYAAHKQGILHRDIKPENLILSARGRCKLTDFGLAGDLRLIAEGHEGPLNFGTPAYAAPEVLRRMTPDVRSDIFSWGATMYHLATGEPPFGAAGSQQIQLRQKQGAELLEARRPDLPRSLCALVQDCLAAHPDERPESFREVLTRLPKRVHESMAESGAPTTGLLTSTVPTEQPAARDYSRLVAVLSALLAVGAIVVLAVVVYLKSGEDQANVANTPLAPLPPTNGALPVNRPLPVNKPPANAGSPDGRPPAFTAEEDAFNSAELEARTALAGARFKQAYDAWDFFIQRYTEGSLAAKARASRAEIVARVGAMRDAAYRNADDACRKALDENRTADALAAWTGFAPELLLPLFAGENDSLIEKLETQKQAVITRESNELAQLLEKSDKLRESDRLLDERALLKAFLPGRTPGSQDKVKARLDRLGQLLDARRQRALTVVASQRKAAGELRGEAARRALAGLEAVLLELANRRFEKANEGLTVLLADCQDTFVDKLIEEFSRDASLAAKAERALPDALERQKRRGVEVEVKVHASIAEDGMRSGRLEPYSGKVTAVKGGEFSLSESGGTVRTLKISLLHFSSVRALLKEGSIDERAALVAWLFGQGKAVEAKSELSRLLKSPGVSDVLAAQLSAMDAGSGLGAAPLRWLRYLAAREKYISPAVIVELYGEASLEARLLTAQASMRRGENSGARAYIDVCAEVSERELISPEAYAVAVEMAEIASTAELRRWLDIESLPGKAGREPYNPAALVKLAQRLLEENQAAEARRLAALALALDASNETAWQMLQP